MIFIKRNANGDPVITKHGQYMINKGGTWFGITREQVVEMQHILETLG